MKKTSNIDGTITGYPGIEAIFDGFVVVVDCTERFEVSNRPTIHIAVPMLNHLFQKLDEIGNGRRVWRGEGQPLAYPSIYSRDLCKVIRFKLLQRSWDQPLLLVGYYLNPILREMYFNLDPTRHINLRSKADKFPRKMIRKQKERAEVTENTSGTVEIDESDRSDNDVFTSSSDLGNGSLSHLKFRRKKRPFDVFMCVDSVTKQNRTLDEVSKYKLARSIQLLEPAKSSLPMIFVLLNIGTNIECSFKISLHSQYVFLQRLYLPVQVREFFKHSK